jgi:hypothetical protein
MSTTTDVSSAGACFPLFHPVELGQVLFLRLPLPRRLREHDLVDASYCVYTLVRGIRRRTDQPRVGVMFYGKQPPRGFYERPGVRYLLPEDRTEGARAPADLRLGDTPSEPVHGPVDPARSGSSRDESTRSLADTSIDSSASPPLSAMPPAPILGAPTPAFVMPEREGTERRAAPRVELFVNFVLQQVDEWGAVLQEELTVADNVARGGARVLTSLGFKAGDIVLLQEASGGFVTRAEVRGISQVQTAIDRLHLRFIDRQAPDRLLQ